MIKKEDKSEFIGQIMDLFEDFLDEYGIKIPQKEGVDDYDPDTPVNLCEKAYDDLAEHLETFFHRWGVIKDEHPQIEYGAYRRPRYRKNNGHPGDHRGI